MTKINLVTVSESDMLNKSELAAEMYMQSPQQVGKTIKAINAIADERIDFDSKQERVRDGKLQIIESKDIANVRALKDNEAYARFVYALRLDPRSCLFPQSQDGGKSNAETSSLKSYKKVRQIANLIFRNDEEVGLENVAKVFAVCAYRFAKTGQTVLTREWCEKFLCSREFSSIDTGTADLIASIEDVRATQMTGGGAATQSGQMIRQFVAFGSARDVFDGRLKNVDIDPNGLVLQAMMVRLGQI